MSNNDEKRIAELEEVLSYYAYECNYDPHDVDWGKKARDVLSVKYAERIIIGAGVDLEEYEKRTQDTYDRFIGILLK